MRLYTVGSTYKGLKRGVWPKGSVRTGWQNRYLTAKELEKWYTAIEAIINKAIK